jgi:hypothetical protein
MRWYVLMDRFAVDLNTPSRAKTAIRRYTCSRPVALALADGLISGADSFFDFGCGHGADVRYLRKSPKRKDHCVNLVGAWINPCQEFQWNLLDAMLE